MTINFNDRVTLTEANGTRTNKNCKQVICLDDGRVFASCLDAAEAMEVDQSAMSACCLGKIRSVKGKHFCYASHSSENLDMLTAQIRFMSEKMAEMEADAAIGRVMREEQEAKRKSEEAHLKAIDDARENIVKANNKLERRKRMMERKEADYMMAIGRYTEAEKELHEAELKLLELEGKVKPEEEDEKE
jgi:hypothetical protein